MSSPNLCVAGSLAIKPMRPKCLNTLLQASKRSTVGLVVSAGMTVKGYIQGENGNKARPASVRSDNGDSEDVAQVPGSRN